MPAFATHYYYAKRVYNELDKEIQKLIDEYRDFYDLGAQGPDIFFYYKPYKKNSVSDFGSDLHEKPVRIFFEDAIENIKKYDSVAALVYLLGVSTHFSLDSSYHPIINIKTKTFNEHMILETELDRKILEKELESTKPYNFRRNLLIKYQNKKYGKDLALVYPTISIQSLDSAIYQTNLFVGKLRSPLGIISKIISILSKKFAKGVDYSNLIIKKTPNPSYDEVIINILKEYDNVVALGVINIKSILANYQGIDRLNDNFDKNFD